MKLKFFVSILAMILTSTFSYAQTQVVPLEDFKSSTLNQPGQKYPQVNSQGYARFRITAPDTKKVTVSLGLGGTRGGTPLTKVTDIVWMGTTAGPMEEGFHYYHLTIDGGVFNDPGTLNFYGSTRWESGIEIPAHDQEFYALKDIPHGNVQQVLLPSKSTNTSSRAFVYTPRDTIRIKKSVTLYCTHRSFKSLSANGMFASYPLWTQILADIFNTPVYIKQNPGPDSVAYGGF